MYFGCWINRVQVRGPHQMSQPLMSWRIFFSEVLNKTTISLWLYCSVADLSSRQQCLANWCKMTHLVGCPSCSFSTTSCARCGCTRPALVSPCMMWLARDTWKNRWESWTLNFPVSVVKIVIFKIHSYNVWHENGWILFWNFKLKVFLIAKDEKQISLRMSLTKALYAVHTSQLKPAQLLWYGVVWAINTIHTK